MTDITEIKRQHTPAEKKYIIKQVHQKRTYEIVYLFVFITFWLVSALVGLTPFLLTMKIDLFSVIFFLIFLLLPYRFLLPLIMLQYSMLSSKIINDYVFRVSGEFRKKTIQTSRSHIVKYYIGEVCVDMPAYWLSYATEGQKVSAEAYFFTITGDVETAITGKPLCTLLTLDNRCSIELESAYGAGSIHNGMLVILSAALSVVFLILSLIFISLSITYPDNAGICTRLKYGFKTVTRYPSVSVLLSSRPVAGTRVAVEQGVVAMINGETSLVDMNHKDLEYYRSIISMPERRPSKREELILDMQSESSSLVYAENWKKYSLLSNNPEFASMKKLFLTEGRAKREKNLKSFRDNNEKFRVSENKIEFLKSILVDENSEEYMSRFMEIEYAAAAELERKFIEKEEASLKQRVGRFFDRILSSNARIKIRPGKGITPLIPEECKADIMQQDITGEVESDHAGKEMILDNAIEDSAKSNKFSVYILSGILLMAVFTGIPAWTLLIKNYTIIKRIKAIYGKNF